MTRCGGGEGGEGVGRQADEHDRYADISHTGSWCTHRSVDCGSQARIASGQYQAHTA